MTVPSTSPGILAPLQASTAVLVLDMLSDFRFPGGKLLFQRALSIAPRVAALRARAHAAGVPVIYVNDNHGMWRSDLTAMLEHCAATTEGARVLDVIAPDRRDLVVLKPRHSGFYATALETLLQYIGAENLMITGLSSNQCVLFTANDAYVRGYRLHIPQDCITASRPSATSFALRYFKGVLSASVAPSTRLRLPRRTLRTNVKRTG